MMVIVIFLFLAALHLVFARKYQVEWREACIGAYLAFFSLIAIGTELLSLFSSLTFFSISLFWCCLLVLSVCLLLQSFRRHYTIQVPVKRMARDKDVTFLVAAIVVIAGLNLFVALLSPPNNWDSMTYHMPRVSHWIQNQSVAFYPTSITRQNHSMPLAEYAVLHLQILSLSDYFANLIQWYSYLICIITVTLLVKPFTNEVRVQCFAGLFVATLPMAILQSTSTQNDLVTSAFCLLFLYFLFRIVHSSSKLEVILCALALGLGLLTKGTAYIFCAAVGVSGSLLAFNRIKNSRLKLLFCGKLMVVVPLALALNVGHYCRNYQLYGHPLSTETSTVLNEVITPEIITVNLVRNMASQLATPVATINNVLTEGLRSLFPFEINNPASTFRNSKFSVNFSLNEDLAGNLPQLLLIAFSLVLATRIRTGNRAYLYTLIGVNLLSMLLFSALLKWQPWGGRLLTPVFIMATPLVGIVISQRSVLFAGMLRYVAVALIIYSIPFVLINSSRPLVPWRGISLFTTPRNELYFASRPDVHADYCTVTTLAHNEKPERIGMLLSNDQYEYPLWVLLKRHAVKGQPLIQHVSVKNISARLENGGGEAPRLVIAGFNSKNQSVNGEMYEAIYAGENISLLVGIDK